MPCEGGSPHAPVEIGSVDTGQLALETKTVEQIVELAYILVLGAMVKESALAVGTVHWRLTKVETAPILALDLSAYFRSPVGRRGKRRWCG